MQERSPVSHAFIRFDSMVVAVSLARAVPLECRDEKACVRWLEREQKVETTIVDQKQPKGNEKDWIAGKRRHETERSFFSFCFSSGKELTMFIH